MRVAPGLLALAAVSAAGQAQGLSPVSSEEILAGADSCIAATSVSGLDVPKLLGEGWSKATISSNGKALNTPLAIYGKGRLMLLVDTSNPKPYCIISGRLSSVKQFPPLQAAFAARFGAPKMDDGKGQQFFFPPNQHIIVLASTGSQDRPAVRVGVGFVEQGSK